MSDHEDAAAAARRPIAFVSLYLLLCRAICVPIFFAHYFNATTTKQSLLSDSVSITRHIRVCGLYIIIIVYGLRENRASLPETVVENARFVTVINNLNTNPQKHILFSKYVFR